MKILYLTKGVVGKHGYYRDIMLAKGLVKQGHDVSFIAAAESWCGGLEITEGVKVYTFFDPLPYQVKKGGLSFFDVLSRIFFLVGKRFDVVFVDSGFRPVTGIPGHLYAWFYKVPYVCEWWDWLGKGGLYERKSKLYQRTLGVFDNYFEVADKRHADGVVPLSQKLKKRAEKLDIPEDRIMILHGGADLSLSNAPSKEDARRKLGIPTNAKVVGFAGLDGQEVQDLRPFLEAIQELKKHIPDFVWFSTGGSLLEKFRQQYDVGTEYFEFGWVDYTNYRACLACADILLLTQEDNLINQARWPNKIGDYLAVGRPVLATPVGEVKFFVEKYDQHGIHLVEWDSKSITQAIEYLFSSDEKLDQMGEANALIAHEECSWDRKAEDLSNFLSKIVQMGKRPDKRG